MRLSCEPGTFSVQQKSAVKCINIGLVLYKNSREEVFKCLNSINNQFNVNMINKLLIKDNSTTCLSYVNEWLNNNHTRFEVQQWQGINNGFGASHNFLIEQSDEEVIAYLCLNPDGMLHPHCLNRLITEMNLNGTNNLFEALQEPVMHPKFYDPLSGETDWCSGACLLIPLELYRKVGGFDENFFLYCEDVDLSWRVRAQGGKCFTVPQALFLHYTFDRVRESSHIEIWKSAVILSYKWCSDTLMKKSLLTLNSLSKTESEFVKKIKKKVEKVPLKSLLIINPNFDNDLIFARLLWNQHD